MNRFITFSLLFLSILLLSGCNGDEAGSSISEEQPRSLTLSSQVIIPIGLQHNIDLAQLWPEIDESRAKSYQVLTGHIPQGDIYLENTSLVLRMNSVSSIYVSIIFDNGVIGYAYISGTSSEYLSTPPLNNYQTTPSESLTLAVKDLLPKGLPSSNFKLLPTIGVQKGTGYSTSSSSIEYTAPATEGTDIINYAFTDGTAVVNGQVHITVSSQPDQIIANNASFDFDGINSEHSIDISPYISSKGSEKLQLLDVYASSGSVKSAAPTDPYNTILHFQANSIGHHEVLYTVTDHNGNYAQGIIAITLTDKSLLPPSVTGFSLIRQQGPASQFDLDLSPYIKTTQPDVSLVNLHQLGSTITGASITVKQAEGGKQKTGPVVTVNYPGNQSGNISFSFAIKDNLGFQSNTAIATIEYLPSMKFTQVTATPSEIIADNTQYTTITGEISNAIGAPIPNLVVSWQADANTLFDESLLTDSDGKATAKLKGTTVGKTTVTITSGQMVDNTKVDLLAVPPNNVIKNGITITKDNAKSNDTDHNQAMVTIVDANNNPVANVPVNWQADNTVSLLQGITVSDSQGIAKAVATSKVTRTSSIEAMLDSGSEAKAQWSFQGAFSLDSIDISGELDHGDTVWPDISCSDCDLNNLVVEWTVDLNDNNIWGDTVIVDGKPVADPTYFTPSYSVTPLEWGKKLKLTATVRSSDGTKKQTEYSVFQWEEIVKIYSDSQRSLIKAGTTTGAVYSNQNKASLRANNLNPLKYTKVITTSSNDYGEQFGYAIDLQGGVDNLYSINPDNAKYGILMSSEPEASSGVLDVLIAENTYDNRGSMALLYKKDKLIVLNGNDQGVSFKKIIPYTKTPKKILYQQPMLIANGGIMLIENQDGTKDAISINVPVSGLVRDSYEDVKANIDQVSLPLSDRSEVGDTLVSPNYIISGNSYTPIRENPLGYSKSITKVSHHDDTTLLFDKTRKVAHYIVYDHQSPVPKTTHTINDVKNTIFYIPNCNVNSNSSVMTLHYNGTVKSYPNIPRDHRSEYTKYIENKTDIVDINYVSRTSTVYVSYQDKMMSAYSACEVSDQSQLTRPIVDIKVFTTNHDHDHVIHTIDDQGDVSILTAGPGANTIRKQTNMSDFSGIDDHIKMTFDSKTALGFISPTELVMEGDFVWRLPEKDFDNKVTFAMGYGIRLKPTGEFEVNTNIKNVADWVIGELSNAPSPFLVKIETSIP